MHYCEACRTSRDWPATTQDIATCDLCKTRTVCNHATREEPMTENDAQSKARQYFESISDQVEESTRTRPQRVRPLYNARDVERMRLWWSARLEGESILGSDILLDEFDKRFPAKEGEQ